MFGTLELTRTNPAHVGSAPITKPFNTLYSVKNTNFPTVAGQHIDITVGEEAKKSSFQTYLLEAVNTLNDQQNDVTKMQKQLIVDPDSVDIHDITIGMAKAQMSLSLAQTVVDRVVKGWSEISTTR